MGEKEYYIFSNLSPFPKESFCQLREFYGLEVKELLERANLSNTVYDRIMSKKRISRNSCLKICLAFGLGVALMKKYLGINGYYLNEFEKEDYIFIKEYEKMLIESYQNRGLDTSYNRI